MRPLISQIVQNLKAPDEAVLAKARAAASFRHEHDRFLKEIEAFHALEYRPPSRSREWTGGLTIAAFNAERLKDPSAVRRLMDRAGAQIGLLCEADIGMARSGNLHTIRELAAPSERGYLYGVEFVELDLGDALEMRRHAGERNARSLHGNAIISGYELEAPHLIPLEESGLWFSGFKGAQRRIGGRIALAARIAGAPRPLWVVGVHLESKTDPVDRQAQIRRLLQGLERLAPGEACIIGGDFNTKALPRSREERRLLIEAPERYEPFFSDLRNAGFGWAQANLDLPTQRAGPSQKHEPPFGKLDWFFVRGVRAENPQVIPALDEQGNPVSDHDLLTVELKF